MTDISRSDLLMPKKVFMSFLDPTFFPGRSAQVIVDGNVVGKIGVIHPEVLQKFDLTNPCSAFEINMQYFL